VINTAAAGALGRMVDRVLRAEGLEVINVVRRPDQAQSLTESGAEIVLDSSSDEFDSELRQRCRDSDVRPAFDAVGGVLTRHLLTAMPPGSTVMVYRGLAEQPSQDNIGDLVFHGKTVTGFWLTRWLPEKNPVQSLRLWKKVQRLIGAELGSEIRDTYPLESVGDAVSSYQAAMSSGKVLIIPRGSG
jgi:NADPH:quinone reductase-like Zn-dependent oxidoreductase